MPSPPSPIGDTQLLQQATTSLTKLILEENSFNGHVILLLTPRSLDRLFGSVEQAKLIRAAVVRRWKTITQQYGKTESDNCFTLETCLPIAVLQSAICFQDSKEISADEEDLTLGQSFAKAWGETSYRNGIGQRYFNPSGSSVESKNSFQYRLWLFLKTHFASQHQLHLDIPAPQAYQGRFLRFVKAQVHLTHRDIKEVSALLNESIDYLNSPSPETVHHLLFSRWREVESSFAPRLREIITASGNDGQLERFYSNIIARYFDASAERTANDRQSNLPASNYPNSSSTRQLRLELVKDTLNLYLFDLRQQTSDDFSSRETLSNFFSKDKSHLLIFYEEDPQNLYQEYALCDRLIPDNRRLVVLTAPNLYTIPKLSVEGWHTAFILGQKIHYQAFSSAQQLPLSAVNGREIVARTRSIPPGGLKHPGTRKTYLTDAGPRIHSDLTVRKVGFSPLTRYKPYQLTPGRYQTPENQFDVADPTPSPVDDAPFGFDLSTWSYTSNPDKINLSGLATTNPIPIPLTRRWIKQQLQVRQITQSPNQPITP